jgi:hypothetical protein
MIAGDEPLEKPGNVHDHPLVTRVFRTPRKTVASGSRFGREAQLYEQYSEHRRPNMQRAVGFST